MGIDLLGMVPSALGTAFQTGLNRANAEWNAELQYNQQEKLLGQQQKYNMAATDYNMQKQLELWEKTGFGPQVEQLKKAGLNPALLYSKGGPGGSTAVATQNNQAAASHTQAESANVGQMAQMGMQLELIKAQKENIEADTKLKLADATKTSGVDTQVAQNQLELIAAQTNNEIIKTAINEQIKDQQFIETHIKTMTMNMIVSQAVYQTGQMYETLHSQVMQNKITEQTMNDQIAIVKQQKINLYVQKLVMESGMQVNKAQIEKMAADIAQGWEGLDQSSKNQRMQGVLNQVRMFNNGKLMEFRAGDVGAESASKQIDQIMNIGKENFKQ